MNIGDLVKIIDQFADTRTEFGLVIQVDDRVCPEQVDVLLFSGSIIQSYADDLERIC
jgi:hypothetical protein